MVNSNASGLKTLRPQSLVRLLIGGVLINGKKHKVAGRVCMDQLLIDLGPDTDVDLYDEAILFGEGPDAQTAEDLADMLDTISYEITCNINKRVPRVYLP